MERTSKTLGRIGVALVGAATFLATPSIGVISASAAPASLQPISPWDGNNGGNVSALNDGTNSTIHLEAELTQATAGDPQATSVRFSYCADVSPADGDCDAAPVIIATDSSSPYSTEWAPPGTIANGSTIHIIYEALTATNVVVDTETRNFVLDNSLSTVHITSPSDGGSVGVWNNKFVAKGTASADDPTVTVNAFNGAGVVTQDTAANTWSAIVPAPATTGVHEIEAIADATDSDEEIWATFYAQQITSSGFTVTPSAQSAGLTGGTATSGNYTVTALDQNGNPISGLNILITGNATGGANVITVTQSGGAGTCTTQDACALTDINGVVKFKDTLDHAATDTITVQTDENNDGVYNSALDEQRTVTFTAYNATPTTLTTTATPNQGVYAPAEYNASNPGDTVTVDGSGNPTGGTGTPYVRTHFVDQNGNPMTNTVITNFNYAVDRTLSDGTHTGSIGATPCNGAYAANQVGTCTTNAFGDIYLPKNDNDALNGSDTFRSWVEVDGLNGETAGDTKAPNLTLSWAGEDLQWLNCNRASGWCNTQAPINTEETYTVHSTVGGQPRNGDTITFDTGGAAILTVTQPAGTIRDDATHAHCVSGQGGAPNGGCSLTVNSATASDVYVSAHDVTTNDFATLHIEFRAGSIAFRQAQNYDNAIVRPVASAGQPQSSDYGCYTDEINIGRPGDVFVVQYLLQDVNGDRLANVSGTATLDHGYFTDVPASYDRYMTNNCSSPGTNTLPWEDVTLDGTPTAGTKIGAENGQVAPESNGTSQPISTDNHGVATFAVSIGRDAGFDDDGHVAVSPTITIGGQSVKLAPINDEYDWADGIHGSADNIGGGHVFIDDADYTFSTDASDCNFNCPDGGGYYNPAGNNALTFTEVNDDSLTGFIPTTHERYVAAWTRDSFGNLTRSGDNAVQVETDGVGELNYNGSGNEIFVTSSYTDDVEEFTIDNDGCSGSDPVDECGTEGHQDVQGSWGVHTVDYEANPGTPPPAFVPVLHQPSFNCTDPVAEHCVDPIGPVDVASLDWYVQAINSADGAHYSISHTPAGKVFLVGTTVTEKVTALDQHDQPIVGLFVTFYGSGPGQFGCNVSCGSSTTDEDGTASYTYAGSTQGNTQVTGVVTPTNGSNNELARMVDKAGFDGAPTIKAKKHVNHPKKINVHGVTRAGAHVVLKKKVKGHDWKVIADKKSEGDGSYSFHKKAKAPWTKWKVRVDDLVTSVIKKTNVGH